MSRGQHCCYLIVYGIFKEIHHDNCLIFTTFITYCAVLRSFDGKSKIFHLSLQKKKYINSIWKGAQFFGTPCSLQLFLAHQVRKSVFFTWDRDSYLTHVVSPRRSADKIHVQNCSVPGNARFSASCFHENMEVWILIVPQHLNINLEVKHLQNRQIWTLSLDPCRSRNRRCDNSGVIRGICITAIAKYSPFNTLIIFPH